jgi:chromosome segregation ATPase
LKKEVEAYQKEREKLKLSIDEQSKEHLRVRESWSTKQNNLLKCIDDLKKELTSTKDAVKSLREENSECKKRISENESTISELSAKVKVSDNKALLKQRDSLKAELKDV